MWSGWNSSSGPANLSLPMNRTCSSSSSPGTFLLLLEAESGFSEGSASASSDAERALGPERMYPVRAYG